MGRKATVLAALLVFLCGFTLHSGADSVLQKLTRGIPVPMDGEETGKTVHPLPPYDPEPSEAGEEGPVLRMQPLGIPTPTETEKNMPVLRMQPLETQTPAEPKETAGTLQMRPPEAQRSTEQEGSAPVLQMLPLGTPTPTETEENMPVLQMLPLESMNPSEAEEPADVLQTQSPEPPAPAVTEIPDTKGIWIRGPERMKAGTKKYYQVIYGEEKPKKAKVTWTLDCDGKTAQVFRNGQVWVRPGAASGTVLTLKAHVEGKDAQGQPWTAEATMEITVI